MDNGDSGDPAAFISYAHEDRAAAHEIAFGLQKRGCEVWIDQGEMNAGDSLIERLAAAIAEVDIVIPLISEHSIDSAWCRRELSMAMTDEIDLEGRFGVKRVLPLRLGDVEMPPVLRDKLYREVDRRRPGEVVPRLWEDIRQHLDSAPARSRNDSGRASYRRGRNLYDKGELTAARRHLHDAAQGGHRGAALLLGEILYDQGDIKKAADEWQFAAGSDEPEIANAAIINYGRMLATHEFSDGGRLVGPRGVLLGGREREDAEMLWRVAAESGHPNSSWAWIGLGRLLEDPPVRGGEPDPIGAEKAYERAAKASHPESYACALFRLGKIKLNIGKADEAIPILTVGATSGDRNWGPQCAIRLGSVYWKQGDEEEAASWWSEAARSVDPWIAEQARQALVDPESIWRKV